MQSATSCEEEREQELRSHTIGTPTLINSASTFASTAADRQDLLSAQTRRDQAEAELVRVEQQAQVMLQSEKNKAGKLAEEWDKLQLANTGLLAELTKRQELVSTATMERNAAETESLRCRAEVEAMNRKARLLRSAWSRNVCVNTFFTKNVPGGRTHFGTREATRRRTGRDHAEQTCGRGGDEDGA